MKRIGEIAAIAALATLGACTHAPSLVATDEAQADGRVFQTKPGMGRVYLVHGDVKGEHEDPTAAMMGAGGIVAGLIGGIIYNATVSREPPKPVANPIAGTYYLNDKPLAALGKEQYLVLDLPPGAYTLRFIHGSIYKPPEAWLRVGVEEGKIRFEKSMFYQTPWAALFIGCPASECEGRVSKGQRIAADWPPKEPPAEKKP